MSRSRVYLEPAWKLPRSYDSMTEHPPDGYDYVMARSGQESFFGSVSGWSGTYRALALLDYVLPPVLAKSLVQRVTPPPAGTTVTYAHGHLVFRPEPWIVEVEYAHLLLGTHVEHLRRWKPLVERLLASRWCRAIRCWCEAGRRTITEGLNSARFAEKVTTVHHAVPARAFVKDDTPRDTIKLLFVGSGNIKGQFVYKGGADVLATFQALRRQHANLELVIRSDLTDEWKARAARIPGVRVIDSVIPWEAMDHEFRTADIFFLPSHNTPPFTILDAMSYALPVVTVDAFANAEYVADGQTGLVASRSRHLPYTLRGTPHPTYNTAAFVRAMQTPDPRVVADLATRITRLIDDPDLRRRLGTTARWEVEQGRFSIETRNRGLQQMFDAARARRKQTPPGHTRSA